MTREELLSALDLTPEPAGPVDLDDDRGTAAPAGPPPSPTALELDAWSLRRGAEALQGDVLSPILADDAAADADRAAHLAADCLAAAFEPSPRLAENCADETRGRYFRQLMETEAYQALHADTRLDPYAAELAAGHFAQGYVALAEKEQEEGRGRGRGEEEQGNEEQGEQGPHWPGRARQTPAQQELKKDLQALTAASKAAQSAAEDVDQLRDAQRAIGDGPGSPQSLDPSTLKARFDKIRQSRRLRAIIEHAGRYRRLAQARQRQKTLHGHDDVVGVELGADLARLLPAELAALGDEDLELDALRRYLERGLMQRDYRGIEAKARGPIVVVVDESGSMAGERIATAKATALAMAWVARHQRRYCCLVGFSDDAEGNWHVSKPGQTDQDALLEWLSHMYNGGTEPTVPLVTLPARWAEIGAPRGKTDVILITDGLLEVSDKVRNEFNAWKAAEQVKLYTLIIGEDSPGDLAGVSDRAWCVPDLSIEQEAIQEIVSI